MSREPSRRWVSHRNLQRGGAPGADRGRLQKQVARAYIAAGTDALDASTIYDFAFPRDRARARSQAARWSVRRVLERIATRIGRSTTRGEPWIWRLR